MAQNTGGDKTEPSLELPSLRLPGLGRRRKKSPEPRPEPEPAPAVEERAEPTPAVEVEPEPTPAAEERTEPEPSPAARPEPRPVVAREERTEPVPAPEVEDRTEQLPATDERSERLAPVEERPSEAPQHRWEQQPAATTPPLAPTPTPAGTAARRAEAPGEHTTVAAAQPLEDERPARRGFSLPALPGPAAAAVTGVVIGITGAVATYLALAGCELVRGVGSCGGAPGFFILLAILVLLVLLGSALLAGFKVLHAGSTSFLAVGIVTVVVMLFLLDHVAAAWMIPVVIALFAAAYLVAHWVSTRFADEDTGRRDWR